MKESRSPKIRVVEELNEVEIPVEVASRLRTLADHTGLTRGEVAARVLETVFADELGPEDLESLRKLSHPDGYMGK